MKVLVGLLLFFAVIGYFRTRALARTCGIPATSGAIDMGYPMPEATPNAAWNDDDDQEQQQESEEEFLARERAMHHANEQHVISEPSQDGIDETS